MTDYCTETTHEYSDAYKYVDSAVHFIYLHKFNTNLAEDSSDMN